MLKASAATDHWETMTGGDDLMPAIFRLWMAQNRP